MEDQQPQRRRRALRGGGVPENNGVALRDTKDRGKPAHVYTAPEWAAFIAGVKDGEFDNS